MVFDFGDEADIWSMFGILGYDVFSEFFEVLKVTGKGDGYVVDLVLETKLHDIVLVVFADGGKRDWHSRETHILLVPQLAVVQDLHSHNVIVDALDVGGDTPVGKQNSLSYFSRLWQVLIRASNPLGGPQMVVVNR